MTLLKRRHITLPGLFFLFFFQSLSLSLLPTWLVSVSAPLENWGRLRFLVKTACE